MSKQNGDKARFGKERKKKQIRRDQNLKLRESLAKTVTGVEVVSQADTLKQSDKV